MMTAGWVPMMAAMMLPSAVPAIARRAGDRDGALAAPLFAGSYARHLGAGEIRARPISPVSVSIQSAAICARC
jgi:predicted metal-binding membrane protein